MNGPPVENKPARKRTAGSRLGRGLDALIGEYQDPVRGGIVDGTTDIALSALSVNPDQPRKSFPDKELNELAASISAKGVLQAILVRPHPNGEPGRYQIVAGERRWRAAKKAGLASIPAVVRSLDETDALEIAIIENVQRTDLNPLEEAESYQLLIARFGRTQKTLSSQTGKSRSHVANTLRLLKLPVEVRDWVKNGRLSAGHARAALATPDPVAAAQRMIDEGMSVRQAETIGAHKTPVPAARMSEATPAPRRRWDEAGPDSIVEADLIAADLTRALRMPVRIHQNGPGGEMAISYRCAEDLDALCRHLSQTLS